MEINRRAFMSTVGGAAIVGVMPAAPRSNMWSPEYFRQSILQTTGWQLEIADADWILKHWRRQWHLDKFYANPRLILDHGWRKQMKACPRLVAIVESYPPESELRRALITGLAVYTPEAKEQLRREANDPKRMREIKQLIERQSDQWRQQHHL